MALPASKRIRLNSNVRPHTRMWRPSPRAVLVISVSALALLSVALTVYAFGSASPMQHARKLPFWALFVPVAVAVSFLQATSYPSVGHRLTASTLFFVGGLVATVVLVFLIGCGFYGACSK